MTKIFSYRINLHQQSSKDCTKNTLFYVLFYFIILNNNVQRFVYTVFVKSGWFNDQMIIYTPEFNIFCNIIALYTKLVFNL